MNSNEILRSLRINHIFSILAAVIVIVTFETGVIAKDALGSLLSQTWTYILQVSAVMLTVLLIPLAVKGFTTSLDKAAGMGDEEFLKFFIRKRITTSFKIFIKINISNFF
jgi:hypothetical protein